MLAALCSLLDRFTNRTSALLILEDLHWADQSALAAVPWLVRELADSRVAIVATFRDDELPDGHSSRRILTELECAGLATRIALRPLDR